MHCTALESYIVCKNSSHNPWYASTHIEIPAGTRPDGIQAAAAMPLIINSIEHHTLKMRRRTGFQSLQFSWAQRAPGAGRAQQKLCTNGFTVRVMTGLGAIRILRHAHAYFTIGQQETNEIYCQALLRLRQNQSVTVFWSQLIPIADIMEKYIGFSPLRC